MSETDNVGRASGTYTVSLDELREAKAKIDAAMAEAKRRLVERLEAMGENTWANLAKTLEANPDMRLVGVQMHPETMGTIPVAVAPEVDAALACCTDMAGGMLRVYASEDVPKNAVVPIVERTIRMPGPHMFVELRGTVKVHP